MDFLSEIEVDLIIEQNKQNQDIYCFAPVLPPSTRKQNNLQNFSESYQQFIFKQLQLFEDISTNFDTQKSIQLSIEEKAQNKDSNLIYGETDFVTLAECLEMINLKDEGVFLDLGHGNGKALLAASLIRKWKNVYGYEIMNSLFEQSISLYNKYKEFIPKENQVT